MRLFDDGGRLLVAYGQAEGGSRYTALLEDAAGTRIDAQPYLTQKAPKVHAVKFAGGQLLTRDEDRLELGGMPLGVGGWESYSGLPGLILAWRTCAAGRQCWATIYSHGAETWTEHIWPAETFGIDVGQSSPGRVAIATRESPGSAGWTGRIVEELLLRQGIVRELGVWRWKPPAGLSLEDPHLVRGAAVPTLIGEAYDLRLGSKGAPSGRVFLAEVGGPLREILQVAAVPGNSEIYGAVMGGRLFVAAELDGARSGLWGWVDGKGLQLVGSAAGGAPCLVVAEGALWISTTAGLWRMG